MSEKFISSRTDLHSYIGSAVCLFKDGVLESYCVLATNYGGDYSKIQNSFDITTGCSYTSNCNVSDAQIAFDNWMSSFF
jgi:hypothetical protein